MWTLVGGGLKTFDQTKKPVGTILPQACSWLKESVTSFDPEKSKLFTSDGKQVRASAEAAAQILPGLEVCFCHFLLLLVVSVDDKNW